MASRAQGITVGYYAYDTINLVGKTGDVSNHTLRLVKDGGSPTAPGNSPSEIDSTHMPGWYQVTLSNTECTANAIILGGISSSSGIVIVGTQITFEQLPTAAANANGGLPILSSSGTTLAYTVSTLTTYTGNTVQTGDAYARLGAPAGASVSADIAEIEGEVDTLVSGVTLTMSQTLGTPRDISSVADGSLQLNDALWAAIGAGAGQKDASSGTTMTVKTPSTGTQIRSFAITNATAPTTVPTKIV